MRRIPLARDDGACVVLPTLTRFAMRNILRREENFFRQGALQASASLQSHNSKTLRPRTEYEACRSYAQSTIIF
jgi:hypothetical protein